MGGTTHTDVAAYVLGLLSEKENAAFEEHLLDCPNCQLDLLELHHLPDVLDRVKATWPRPPVPEPAPRVLGALLEEAAATRRKRRRSRQLAVAAAVALIIAGPVVTLTFFTPSSVDGTTLVAPIESPPAAPSSAKPPAPGSGSSSFGWSDAGSAVGAEVVVQGREWGSTVDLELRGIVGPKRCQLLAIARSGGAPWVVTTWTVPVKGYGVDGSPDPLRVTGSTALSPGEIERFEIRGENGQLLASIST
ncbi:Putative zinc-finger [Amycolatopsis xylanica]|uniref:Putative zinc-finger n=1 Tax=Amycolatopsis xylanica TaxID=589385 RepID=A0A1H2USX3_9PSEU|nr:zf-HC2 domain-containing protein [Amycolatopsis xylanica]SDW58664.1 Putative zinc-finger [Amycolatopsis xylanica]